MDTLGFVFMALVGLGCAGYAPFGWAKLKIDLARRSARAVGVVTANETRLSTHRFEVGRYDPPTKHPVVVYEVGGRVHELVSDTGASIQLLHPGDQVDVAYNPGNPDDAQILHPKMQATEAIILVGVGVIGIVVFLIAATNLAGA